MDPTTTATTILAGAFSGVLAAAGGWAKTRAKGPIENFDQQKFLLTALLGAVVGGIAAYRGWDYASAETWFATIGGVVAVEYIGKAVWRSFDRPKKSKKVAKKADEEE